VTIVVTGGHHSHERDCLQIPHNSVCLTHAKILCQTPRKKRRCRATALNTPPHRAQNAKVSWIARFQSSLWLKKTTKSLQPCPQGPNRVLVCIFDSCLRVNDRVLFWREYNCKRCFEIRKYRRLPRKNELVRPLHRQYLFFRN
jgi:hypothetical protein